MTQKSPPSPEAIDTTLEVLSNASSREVLLSLSTPSEDSLAQDDLVGPADREHAIELVHHRLPKLDDDGFLKWDRETVELWRGPGFEDARPFLETIRDHGRSGRS